MNNQNSSDIFTDMRQTVQFAFALDGYRIGGSHGAAVRLALADAHVTRKPEIPRGADANELHAYGGTILRKTGAMMKAERAALTAAFSRDADARQQAMIVLQPLFCSLLKFTISDFALVRKLVQRHYLPIRERGGKWELHALADEFKVGRERICRAAMQLDKFARQLEDFALDALAEAMATPPHGRIVTPHQPVPALAA